MKMNLLRKMMLYILAPTVLGLAILALIANSTASTSFKQVNDVQLTELVQLQANEINNIMTYIQGVTNSYGTMEAVTGFASSYNADPNSYQTSQALSRVSSFLQHIVDTYRDIGLGFIVNKQGILTAAPRADLIGLDLSAYKSVQASLRGERYIEVRKSIDTGNFSAFISTPIIANNQVQGVFATRLDLLALNKATLERISITESSTSYIYDQDFNIVMDNLNQYLGQNDGDLEYTREMDLKKEGIFDYVFEGESLRGYYAHIPVADWIVVFDVPSYEINEPVNELRNEIYLIAITIIVLISIIIFVVARGISSSLQKASGIATYVAEGNLVLTKEQQDAVDAHSVKSDEIGSLARGLDIMIKKMASMVKEAEAATDEAKVAVAEAEVAKQEATEAAEQAREARREGLLDAARQLEDVVSILASASEELSAQIELSSNSVEEQAHRLAVTATAMDEMNSTVIEVARNSGESAQITENTKQKAIAGAEITEKCKNSINAVQEESNRLRTNMNALAEHANSINTVMGVITDIADQTNLLALNAAIEAARAGEAGRGFAVVADEVRKLAEKTITSATDVANAISAIQSSTESNVKQVDIAVQSIEEATELANQSGEALRDILEMAELSANGVSAIATASEEQSVTVRGMADAIEEINSIATNTNNAMIEANSAVSALSAQAQELTNIIASLKR